MKDNYFKVNVDCEFYWFVEWYNNVGGLVIEFLNVFG